MNNQSIIFLDIDGVLNSMTGIHTKVPGRGVMGVEELLIKRFKTILKETDAEIVLCSTWRLHDNLLPYLSAEIQWGSRYVGNTGVWPWWGKEKCPYKDERQWEVEKWIDEHPEIQKWVCIDDSVYPVNRPKGIKITCDNSVGITEEQTQEVIQFLN